MENNLNAHSESERATDSFEKKGYLVEDFKIFHLTDRRQREFTYHYHDFYKILILLSGNVSYTVEGRTYRLAPFDIVLVSAGEIHRPCVLDESPYERIILYVSKEFLDSCQGGDYSLGRCFEAPPGRSHVLRMPDLAHSRLYAACSELLSSFGDQDYAWRLRQRLLFLEFMVELNRAVVHGRVEYIEVLSSNAKVLQTLDYIHAHLTEELSPESIASAFFVNKYYLMHLFKSETGYTLGSYITNKRLLLARELLSRNIPATRVCYDCGFKNYSTFSRAYKKCFRDTPRNASGKFV